MSKTIVPDKTKCKNILFENQEAEWVVDGCCCYCNGCLMDVVVVMGV